MNNEGSSSPETTGASGSLPIAGADKNTKFEYNIDRESLPTEALELLAKELRQEMYFREDLVKDKEQKKLLIFRYSTASIPIVGAMLVGSFVYFGSMISHWSLLNIILAFNVSSILIISGILIVSLSVIKYLSSMKSDVILAERQINCYRAGFFNTLKLILEKDEKNRGLFKYLVEDHDKYPKDNTGLRDAYREREYSRVLMALDWVVGVFWFGNKDHWLRMALKGGSYRKVFHTSADLFSIFSIGWTSIIISIIPFVGNIYIYFSNPSQSNAEFIFLVLFSLVNILLMGWFSYSMLGTLYHSVTRMDSALNNEDDCSIRRKS